MMQCFEGFPFGMNKENELFLWKSAKTSVFYFDNKVLSRAQ
jgi:hypothetical protein